MGNTTSNDQIKRVEELGCDGIVMGAQARGTVGSLLLGSVALKVHTAKPPVTLIT
jgi:nucleotide-binding universal stress UspA family protein